MNHAEAMPQVGEAAIIAGVTKCLNKYARAVDRCDWDGVRACYENDAYDYHGAYRGGVEGLVADMISRHAELDRSMHAITNISVSPISDVEASVESYCLCYLRQRDKDAQGLQSLTTVRCRYLDRMTCRDGRNWQIASRMVVYDEMRTSQIRDTTPEVAAHSARDHTDPVWAFVNGGSEWDSRDYSTLA